MPLHPCFLSRSGYILHFVYTFISLLYNRGEPHKSIQCSPQKHSTDDWKFKAAYTTLSHREIVQLNLVFQKFTKVMVIYQLPSATMAGLYTQPCS